MLALALPAAASPRALKMSLPKAPRPAAEAGCADFSFPIYFRTQSDQLTVPARELILQSAAFASTCPISAIKVVGLDSEGPSCRADAPTRSRARWPKAASRQTAHGILAAEPAASPLLARKAEVYVHFVAPRSEVAAERVEPAREAAHAAKPGG